jgi:hypothetical protein
MSATSAAEPTSYWTKRALETLFVYSPIATSIGALLGTSIFGAVQVARPYLLSVSSINTDAITWWWCEITAILLSNLIAVAYAVATGIHRIPPQIAAVLRVIHHGRRRGSITARDEQRLYVETCEKLMRSVVLDDATSLELKNVENTIATQPPEEERA